VTPENQELNTEYLALKDAVTELLYQHDPQGISYRANEYEPEARAIVPRLRNCRSEQDVARVIHQTFVEWFSSTTAGPVQHYEKIARDVWKLWQQKAQ
jgi:hypothetical protein